MTEPNRRRKWSTEEKLHIEIYLRCSLFDGSSFEQAWVALQKPVIPKSRYGRVQPYKFPLTADAGPAFDLFRHDRALMFGNQDRSFQAIIETVMQGFTIWTVFVAQSLWRSEWHEWLVELCSTTPVLFGRACSEREMDVKHGVHRSFPEGRSRSQIGSSRPELYKFLPGVYWFTVLGEELATSLDVAALTRFPDLAVKQLPGRQLALELASDPFAEGDELAARVAREREIAAALGDDYFFDRERPERALQPVPAFLAALENLRPPSGDPRNPIRSPSI